MLRSLQSSCISLHHLHHLPRFFTSSNISEQVSDLSPLGLGKGRPHARWPLLVTSPTVASNPDAAPWKKDRYCEVNILAPTGLPSKKFCDHSHNEVFFSATNLKHGQTNIFLSLRHSMAFFLFFLPPTTLPAKSFQLPPHRRSCREYVHVQPSSGCNDPNTSFLLMTSNSN